jgi:hypothetical protein
MQNGDPNADGGGDFQLTYYGYEQPHQPDWDYNSWMGIGDRQNDIVPGYSAALSQSARKALLGVDSPTSTGQQFQYKGQTFRDDDTSPQKFANIDVYSPGGIPGTANYNAGAGPLGKNSGQSLTSNSLKSDVAQSTGSQDTPAAPSPTPESDTTQFDNHELAQQSLEQQPAGGQNIGQSIGAAAQAIGKASKFAQSDNSKILEEVQKIHPDIQPANLDELWKNSASWQDFTKSVQNSAYSKSLDLMKELYKSNVTDQTGTGGGQSLNSNSSALSSSDS